MYNNLLPLKAIDAMQINQTQKSVKMKSKILITSFQILENCCSYYNIYMSLECFGSSESYMADNLWPLQIYNSWL